jgi:tetratricopeptide (TPR) repeat protein
MIPQLLKILRESIKAVPAMKYALAVAGILAVVAMVGAFKVSPQTAVFGSIITLVLMVAMVIFARLTTTAPRHFLLPVKIMLWAFLLVTVATASLLFTSAFFQWPRGLHEIIGNTSAPPTTRGKETEEVRNLIAAAQRQRTAGEYRAAWDTIVRAVSAAPDSSAAQNEQLEIALVWIRNMKIPTTESMADAVRPLTECLHFHAVSAKGALAADIEAHLGRARIRTSYHAADPAAIRHYEAALALDSSNPFANAMLGLALAFQKRPIIEVKRHFEQALGSRRELEFVRRFQIQALGEFEPPEGSQELIRVVDAMRRSGEPISNEQRSAVLNEVYYRPFVEHETALASAVPSADHLATFRWLTSDRDVSSSAYNHYALARLTEAAGDFAGAAAIYSKLLKEDTQVEGHAKAGLARCEQRLAAAKSPSR